jgi:hypothetical protein
MIRGSLLRSVESAMALAARQQQQHRRFAWQAVLTKVRDPATGEFKYRDWDEIMAGARDPMKGDQSLLDRYQAADRHTKRTTLKKQLKARIHYERKMKQVDDLIRYVRSPPCRTICYQQFRCCDISQFAFPISYVRFMKDHPDDLYVAHFAAMPTSHNRFFPMQCTR